METILLKALEKDRERRYRSVAELAEDLRRYLSGRVICARPAGIPYRIWKWTKRNPVTSATAGTALAAVILLGGYVLLVSYPQIRKERDRAERQYAQVIRLADVKRLDDLVKAAEELWPADPHHLPALDAWIQRAEALLDRLPSHRRSIEGLRAKAVETKKTAATGTPSWIFEDTETAWQHDLLFGLVSGLEALGDPRGGLLAKMKVRRTFAASVRKRSIEDHRAAWDRAVASIADPKVCPCYKGLKIAPQLGLVPLGRDPDSGLWEFAHLQTGTIPERGEDGKPRLTDSTGLILVLLPGGTFRMGAVPPSDTTPEGAPNVDPNAYPEEGPVHAVAVAPFFLSKYEMTQGQWLRFTGENPSLYRSGKIVAGRKVTLLHPVEQVDWYEARTVLSRLGLRLPTEAEWEYAARAGTATVWWSGKDTESLAGAANLCDRYAREHGIPSTWRYEAGLDDGYLSHAPVGSFRPNRFGLHDMCGNVFEWCADAFARYERTPVDGSAYEDERADKRILRGGSHLDVAVDLRSAARSQVPPLLRTNNVGLRPARDLEGPAPPHPVPSTKASASKKARHERSGRSKR